MCVCPTAVIQGVPRTHIGCANCSSFVLVAQAGAGFVSSSGSSNAALQTPLQVSSGCSCGPVAVVLGLDCVLLQHWVCPAAAHPCVERVGEVWSVVSLSFRSVLGDKFSQCGSYDEGSGRDVTSPRGGPGDAHRQWPTKSSVILSDLPMVY